MWTVLCCSVRSSRFNTNHATGGVWHISSGARRLKAVVTSTERDGNSCGATGFAT